MSAETNRIRRMLSHLDQAAVDRYIRSGSVQVPIEQVETAAITLETAAGSMAMTRGVSGPLVRAGEPNRNGALFLRSDLDFGLPSITGQPITVNHGNYSVGWISEAKLEKQPDLGDYVDMHARVWAQRFPEVWAKTEAAHVEGQAFFSMECVPEKVGCGGCGVEAANLSECCDHILQRSAPRRQINPTFIGAALVLPPEKPGWPDARLNIV